MVRALFAVFILVFALSSQASWKVQAIRDTEGLHILSVQKSRQIVGRGQHILLQSMPHILDEGPHSSRELYQEYLVDDSALTPQMQMVAAQHIRLNLLEDADVKTLVSQGPTENRINLTITGDGYTGLERDKFFADAVRTTQQLFGAAAYHSYLPLFNVHAVFVASNESGIGDGDPKDTALKLYRDPKGSKRAIIPGDEAAAERAMARAPATDYPIIIANDNYYGGLGGRFAISTSSLRSGIVVLRHELGHNFGNVGEEYDGGQVYAGANFSPSPDAPWKYWADAGYKINEALFLGGAYVWQNLNGNPFTTTFKFPGGDYFFNVDISSVGWATPDDVIAAIDGKRLPLKGDFTDDRSFYQIGPVTGFPAGEHTLSFTENIHDGDNVLAFANLYAMPHDYDFTKNRIGAYATYNSSGRKVGYRPTHSGCPMRDMLTPEFCVVDKENMWLRFLNRVSLIDSVEVNTVKSFTTAERLVTIKTPSLPGMSIFWYRMQGTQLVEMEALRNQTSWKAAAGLTGTFRARVKFETPEVRRYNNRFISEKVFTL